MAEVHKSTNKLYDIVLDHPRLRVQQAPDIYAQTFLFVDSDERSVGPSFKWPIIRYESIEELTRKVQRYLTIPERLSIKFRLTDGTSFIPMNPFREIPREPFEVLVYAIE
jgi:hypothetical protein